MPQKVSGVEKLELTISMQLCCASLSLKNSSARIAWLTSHYFPSVPWAQRTPEKKAGFQKTFHCTHSPCICL